MRRDGFVSTTYVHLLYEYLEARGLDAERVLGEPAPDLAAHGLGRFPMARWATLLAMAEQTLREPALGIAVGRRITPAHIGVLGYVVLACANLGEALARFQRYIRLVYDHGPLEVRDEGDSLVLEWGEECLQPGQLVDELAITALIQFARNVTGTECSPGYVSFVNPPPADTSPYTRYFRCAVGFGHKTTVVRIPRENLLLPLRQPDPVLLGILEQQAETLLQNLPQAEPLLVDVRRFIARLCREGEPTLDAVAAQMNLAPRTLQRRLSSQGMRFQQLLDETRLLMAEDYLRDRRLQLTEIAALLGYAEQSAFNHAFRRWTGYSPRQYRRQVLEESADKPVPVA